MMGKTFFFAWVLILCAVLGAGCDSSDDDSNVTLNDGDTVSFTLLQTTDVHHRVIGTGPSATYGTGATDQTVGGYARLATTIDGIRSEKAAAGTPVLLVDSGDFLMGTVYDLTLGEIPAALSFICLMEYDAITLGNHEFDYGPGPLAGFIDRAKIAVPIVASNMVTAPGDNADDGLEALVSAGTIKPSLLLTLPDGLKVGILGLLGEQAEGDAPLAVPVTFKNDLDDAEEVAYLQARVDALRTDGAHVVIALSHSGLISPASATPTGDDMALADKVKGIDIIASGHEHEKTESIVIVGDTRIICAGQYGENLTQLDVTVTVGSGIKEAALTNHGLEASVALATRVEFMVDLLDAGINEAMAAFFPFKINDVIAGNASGGMGKPASVATETGMGNLVADSLRYLVGPAVPAMGLVANGVVRNGFLTPQGVSFADIYSVLPLGMTLDPDNQGLPGYPLLNVLMDKTSIENLCQLIAYIEAAANPTFMEALASSGDPAQLALYGALLNLPPNYYMNLSGIQFNHNGAAGRYQVDTNSIKIYAAGDYKCANAPSLLSAVPAPMLPCVLDLYMVLMLQDVGLQALLGPGGLNIPIVANTPTATPVPVTMVNVLSCRLDQDSDDSNGIQEVKEWMALLQFLTGGEFASNTVMDASYGADAIKDGEASSRVNEVP